MTGLENSTWVAETELCREFGILSLVVLNLGSRIEASSSPVCIKIDGKKKVSKWSTSTSRNHVPVL